MKKLTNATALTTILNAMEKMEIPISSEYSNSEIMEKLIAIREGFIKKSSATRKPSAKQIENNDLRIKIMEVMSDGVLRNTSDIRDAMGFPTETTPQRIAGLIKPLVENGLLVAKEIKRKRFYSIPDIE